MVKLKNKSMSEINIWKNKSQKYALGGALFGLTLATLTSLGASVSYFINPFLFSITDSLIPQSVPYNIYSQIQLPILTATHIAFYSFVFWVFSKLKKIHRITFFIIYVIFMIFFYYWIGGMN